MGSNIYIFFHLSPNISWWFFCFVFDDKSKSKWSKFSLTFWNFSAQNFLWKFLNIIFCWKFLLGLCGFFPSFLLMPLPAGTPPWDLFTWGLWEIPAVVCTFLKAFTSSGKPHHFSLGPLLHVNFLAVVSQCWLYKAALHSFPLTSPCLAQAPITINGIYGHT